MISSFRRQIFLFFTLISIAVICRTKTTTS